jgi:hypothetical protein
MLELLATLAAGWFSGAALYVSLVEHPARMQVSPALALAEFGPSYRRGSVMQASLAACGLIFSVLSWLSGGGATWLIGGVLLGAAIPYTLIVILPVNKRLLEPGLAGNPAATADLLRRWGRLHARRTIAGSVAFLIFLSLLMR